jgi:hypothetical protein
MLMQATIDAPVSAEDAIHALWHLNLQAKTMRDVRRVRAIYDVKPRVLKALFAEGYCVGVALDEPGPPLFTFIVADTAYQFHQPMDRLGIVRLYAFSTPLPEDVRAPKRTPGRYDERMGLARRFCEERGF